MGVMKWRPVLSLPLWAPGFLLSPEFTERSSPDFYEASRVLPLQSQFFFSIQRSYSFGLVCRFSGGTAAGQSIGKRWTSLDAPWSCGSGVDRSSVLCVDPSVFLGCVGSSFLAETLLRRPGVFSHRIVWMLCSPLRPSL